MDILIEDHCATCGTVDMREATVMDGRGSWICVSCDAATIWDTLEVLRLSLGV